MQKIITFIKIRKKTVEEYKRKIHILFAFTVVAAVPFFRIKKNLKSEITLTYRRAVLSCKSVDLGIKKLTL